MADFLTRLAGRTLGVVPTVQPMIASMYAPGSGLPADQAGRPVSEEVSSSIPVQPAPTGREGTNLPTRESLQESELAAGQESGASIFANPMPFSSGQDTALPQAGDKPALPALPRDNALESQNTLSSIFVTGERVQQGAIHTMPPSPPVVPLPAPDKTKPLEEVQAALPVAAQMQLENASFIAQEQWSGDASMNTNGPGRQGTAGDLHQSAMSENSYSRASRRWAGAAANRNELSLPVTAPEAPAAPTIQVTIGRIEVRAAPPPQPQRQAQRPEPRVMSLEEYLNQQAKGGQ